METAVSSIGVWLAAVQPDLVAGYSMGGRLALHVALQRPGVVPAMLLISTGLGIADTAERAARRAADAELAAGILRDGTEAFIDRWMDHPVAGTGRVAAELRERDRQHRLVHEPVGLAAALVGLGPAAHEPLHDRLGELEMPLGWMAGSDDPAYARIAEEAAALSGGKAVIVDGAGHNLVLEAPDAVGKAIDGLQAQR